MPAAVQVFPREGILSSAVTIGVAPNAFEGKFSFPIISYFNLSSRLAPLLVSEMLLPLSGRKKGVDQHRWDLQLSSRSQSDGFISQNEGYFRASGLWLSQILYITSIFPSYCYIMRHLRMKQQQILTLTEKKKITLFLKKFWAAKLLRTQQVSPKPTHYWYTKFLLHRNIFSASI